MTHFRFTYKIWMVKDIHEITFYHYIMCFLNAMYNYFNMYITTLVTQHNDVLMYSLANFYLELDNLNKIKATFLHIF